jgi:adenosine kinase
VHIAVTGSIATDHLMSFPGRFADQLVGDQLDRLSLSFLVDELQIRRGGVAANIAFGMGALGLHPILVGAVGRDFEDYRSWLERAGVDTESELAPIAARVGGLDLVVISPNDPDAMIRHTQESRQRGYAFAADPSQQLARMDGAQIRELCEGAKYLFCNDYEHGLLLQKAGWSDAELRSRIGTLVTTLGGKGVRVQPKDGPDVEVPVVPEYQKADPTGVGDAFRSGFLGGLTWGFNDERSAQVGSLLATLALETVGTQEYTVDAAAFTRFRSAFGDAAADEVAAHVSR